VGLRDEILQQPAVVERLVRDSQAGIDAIGRALTEREIDSIVIAARGTSDHAAIYAQYVFGVRHRLPVALAAPSILSLYGVEPRFRRALVIGISQSGASPDVAGVVAAARRQGAPTIAITNEPASALAKAAEFLIDLGAGDERAVAATKTYTAELAAIALLSVALGGDPVADAGLPAISGAIATALEEEPAAAAAAGAFAAMESCTVLGRGFEYATAREWALKLKELAYVLADPYSAADFQHGPIALVEPRSAVFMVAPSGHGAADVKALAPRLASYGADLLVVSDRADLRALGRLSIALPTDVPEWLMPIVSIVPAQLFAMHLAIARGIDPETPRHLMKVTSTR
jgi:glucosamine--fructose-6-phosphate aminotransferase (isomerizing)